MNNIACINNASSNVDDEIISIKEAAKILGLNYHTAYNLILSPESSIVYFDYGFRNKRVLKTSVIDYREKHKVKKLQQ